MSTDVIKSIRAGDKADFRITYALDGTPVDLTGKNVRLAFVRGTETLLLVDNTIPGNAITVTPLIGQIDVHLDSDQTDLLNDSASDQACTMPIKIYDPVDEKNTETTIATASVVVAPKLIA